MMTMIFFSLYKTFTLDVSQKNSFYIFCINVSTGNIIYIFLDFQTFLLLFETNCMTSILKNCASLVFMKLIRKQNKKKSIALYFKSVRIFWQLLHKAEDVLTSYGC